MVPIYSIVSFLSYLFYRHAVYFEVIRDCYEAFAIASFFALVCSYIAPNLHDQKDFFRRLPPRAWIWPVQWFKRCCGSLTRTPRSGLTQFNVSTIRKQGLSSPLIDSADHLVRYFPILFRAGLHDFRSSYHPSCWQILSGISESGVCTCLGKLPPLRD